MPSRSACMRCWLVPWVKLSGLTRRPRQRVVADRARRLQAFLEVARLDRVAVLARPDAGIAIGLQFHQHLELVRLRAGSATARCGSARRCR